MRVVVSWIYLSSVIRPVKMISIIDDQQHMMSKNDKHIFIMSSWLIELHLNVLETKMSLTRRRETGEDIMLMLQRMMKLPQRETDKTVMILQVMKNMF